MKSNELLNAYGRLFFTSNDTHRVKFTQGGNTLLYGSIRRYFIFHNAIVFEAVTLFNNNNELIASGQFSTHISNGVRIIIDNIDMTYDILLITNDQIRAHKEELKREEEREAAWIEQHDQANMMIGYVNAVTIAINEGLSIFREVQRREELRLQAIEQEELRHLSVMLRRAKKYEIEEEVLLAYKTLAIYYPELPEFKLWELAYKNAL